MLASVSLPPLLAALAGALAVTAVVAVTLGPITIAPGRVWAIIVHHLTGWGDQGGWSVADDQIVWQIRLPRVLLAALVGASLSVVGATMQAMVRNALADPFILGITSGASAGGVLVIVLGVGALGVYGVSAGAFAGALASLLLVFALARASGGMAPTRLVLIGVAVTFALSGLTSFMILSSDQPQQTNAVLFWLLGSLAGARWSLLLAPAVALLGGTAYVLLQARALNALSAGEETAVGLGVDPERLRRQLFVLTALLTGLVVAISGGIGFVGLILPHAVRLLVGPSHHRLLPVAALLGAVFLIWVDLAARTLLAPTELPVGVITSLCGAPFFLLLLVRHGRASQAVA
ncbi:MAG: FecCD family ABC transporter permease [Egibacteraceae bacterium]